MAKTSNKPRFLVALFVLIIAAIGVYAWIHKHRQTAEAPVSPQAKGAADAGAPPVVATDRIDAANEGRIVQLSGDLKVLTPARDTQLGIEANAVMLLRYADMLQWQEQCSGANCTYHQVWSPQLMSSKRFRVPEGHQNPTRLPVTTARFSAGEVRLGAFKIDSAMLANSRMGSALQIKPIAYPVTQAQLPSNLAISFREVKGILYAGDPEHPAVGDLRVIYRVIPAQKVEILGTQRGDAVIVQKARSTTPPS